MKKNRFVKEWIESYKKLEEAAEEEVDLITRERNKRLNSLKYDLFSIVYDGLWKENLDPKEVLYCGLKFLGNYTNKFLVPFFEKLKKKEAGFALNIWCMEFGPEIYHLKEREYTRAEILREPPFFLQVDPFLWLPICAYICYNEDSKEIFDKIMYSSMWDNVKHGKKAIKFYDCLYQFFENEKYPLEKRLYPLIEIPLHLEIETILKETIFIENVIDSIYKSMTNPLNPELYKGIETYPLIKFYSMFWRLPLVKQVVRKFNMNNEFYYYIKAAKIAKDPELKNLLLKRALHQHPFLYHYNRCRIVYPSNENKSYLSR